MLKIKYNILKEHKTNVEDLSIHCVKWNQMKILQYNGTGKLFHK